MAGWLKRLRRSSAPPRPGCPTAAGSRPAGLAERGRLSANWASKIMAVAPSARERDRDADDDLVEPEPDAEDDHDDASRRLRRRAGEEAEAGRVAVVGPEEADVGADEHHPLEADVEHAGALRDRLAERGEHQRHAGEQAARDHARPEHVVRIWLARAAPLAAARRLRARLRPGCR